jgi:hypothetical protein
MVLTEHPKKINGHSKCHKGAHRTVSHRCEGSLGALLAESKGCSMDPYREIIGF